MMAILAIRQKRQDRHAKFYVGYIRRNEHRKNGIAQMALLAL